MTISKPTLFTPARGFTIVELMITLAILAVLAMVALPLAEHTVKRDKELQLRRSLRDIRTAIDAYKKAYDEGKIAPPLSTNPSDPPPTGYPPTLAALVGGVPNAKQAGQTLYFLRRIPADPFAPNPALPPEKTWGLRSYSTSADNPSYDNVDVYDVYSLSTETGLNGVPYKTW